MNKGKVIKKVFFAFLMIVLLSAMVVQTDARPIKLKWTILESDTDNSIAEVHRRMAAAIEKETEGRVTVQMFWGASLGKVTDFLKMTSQGLAQGGTLMGTYHQWEIPLLAAAGMPFLTSGYRDAPRATWELYQEWAPMKKELDSYNVKMLGVIQPHDTYVEVVKQASSLDDLKGTKLWVLGFWQQMADALGIVNVPLTPPEVYDGLQKGILSGIWGVVYHGPKMLKFTDHAKYFYYLPFGGNNLMHLVVNLKTWNKISAADQKKIEDIVYDLVFNVYPKLMDGEVETLDKYYASQGVVKGKFPDKDLATIESRGKELIWGKWLEQAEERGVPGEEWLKLYQEKVKK